MKKKTQICALVGSPAIDHRTMLARYVADPKTRSEINKKKKREKNRFILLVDLG